MNSSNRERNDLLLGLSNKLPLPIEDTESDLNELKRIINQKAFSVSERHLLMMILGIFPLNKSSEQTPLQIREKEAIIGIIENRGEGISMEHVAPFLGLIISIQNLKIAGAPLFGKMMAYAKQA